MKTQLLILLLFQFLGCNVKQIIQDAQLRFDSTEADLGELKYNGDANCLFTFTNTGKTPLLIQQVKTSCGCTTPEWPNKPINPGKSGTIRIEYDTSLPGRFHKLITVFYNGPESPKMLNIKGDVKFPDERAVKLND